jgi:hypothetical protein
VFPILFLAPEENGLVKNLNHSKSIQWPDNDIAAWRRVCVLITINPNSNVIRDINKISISSLRGILVGVT